MRQIEKVFTLFNEKLFAFLSASLVCPMHCLYAILFCSENVVLFLEIGCSLIRKSQGTPSNHLFLSFALIRATQTVL